MWRVDILMGVLILSSVQRPVNAPDLPDLLQLRFNRPLPHLIP